LATTCFGAIFFLRRTSPQALTGMRMSDGLSLSVLAFRRLSASFVVGNFSAPGGPRRIDRSSRPRYCTHSMFSSSHTNLTHNHMNGPDLTPSRSTPRSTSAVEAFVRIDPPSPDVVAPSCSREGLNSAAPPRLSCRHCCSSARYSLRKSARAYPIRGSPRNQELYKVLLLPFRLRPNLTTPS